MHNEESAIVEVTPEPAKPKPRDTMADIGLARFSVGMNDVCKHINQGAVLLEELQKHRDKVRQTVEEIQRWRAAIEGKLKRVPQNMVDPLTTVFKTSEDEMYAALQGIGDEMTMIDLSAEAPIPVKF